MEFARWMAPSPPDSLRPLWTESFADAGFRGGFYQLPVGCEDDQQPHDRDETYTVLAGRAVLEVASAEGTVRLPAESGVVLFVGAGVAHRFVEITEPLQLWVAFGAIK